MKRGIDIGNYSVKEFPNLIIKSLITSEENLLGSKLTLEFENKTYYIGEGKFEIGLNKSTKESFLPLLLTSLAVKNENTDNQQVVCGLPINQYKTNKEELKELILSCNTRDIKLNGIPKKITISNFEVYPEGIGAYYSLSTNDDVILIDIGGGTTDIAFVANNKIVISSTVAVGTLNIYKDIADKLNSTHGLDLDISAAERIIDRGYLLVDGIKTDLSFITEVLKKNFIKINDDLVMKFPVRTEKIILAGGGFKLFEKAFRNRYNQVYVADNPIFANAIGFRKVADMLWQ